MKRILLMIWLLPTLLMGAGIPESGTLIVTFKTNNKGERIERVRFWLKDEKAKQTLFPRGSAFVDDREKKTRMVVIEDLEPGQYTLEFLVPNLDGRFESAPQRKVKITRGEVVKIDQEIRSRKAYWSNHSKPLKRKSAAEPELVKPVVKEETETEPPPVLTIEEILDNQDTVVTQSPSDELDTEDPVDNQEEVNVTYGKLIVSYELREDPTKAGNVRFRLVFQDGETTVHPVQGSDTEVPLHAGKMVMVQSLPTGTYQMEFYLDGEKDIIASKTFEIKEGRTKSIHQSLKTSQSPPKEPVAVVEPEPQPVEIEEKVESVPSLTLSANIPTAEFVLIHTGTGETIKRKGREVTVDSLPSGTYELYLNSYDPFFIPPPKELLEISEGEEPITKEVAYLTLGRVKISTNVSQATAYITPMENNHPAYKKEVPGGEVALYLPEGKYRITFSPIKGKKIPEPVDIHVQSLETEQVNVYFSVG